MRHRVGHRVLGKPEGAVRSRGLRAVGFFGRTRHAHSLRRRGWPWRPLAMDRGRAWRLLDRGLGMGTCVRRKPFRIESSVEWRGAFRKLAGLSRSGGSCGVSLPLAISRTALEVGCVDCVLARGPHGRDALLPPLLLPVAPTFSHHGRSRLYALGPPRDLGHAFAGDPARALRTRLLERPA